MALAAGFRPPTRSASSDPLLLNATVLCVCVCMKDEISEGWAVFDLAVYWKRLGVAVARGLRFAFG